MHPAGDKKLLAECFFIGIGQKMSYARVFFALLRLDRGVAVPKTYYASARISLVSKPVSDESIGYLCGRK